MVLRLDDKWVWDFWFAHRGGQDHIFYLQAPRELGRPELRHRNATIGHAVSSNRRDWQVLPDAIRPGADGSWDDLATWTGSAIEHESRWYMLYTGVSRADDGLVQRIGLAVSDDLVQWSKHVANPVLEADPRWYEAPPPGPLSAPSVAGPMAVPQTRGQSIARPGHGALAPWPARRRRSARPCLLGGPHQLGGAPASHRTRGVRPTRSTPARPP